MTNVILCRLHRDTDSLQRSCPNLIATWILYDKESHGEDKNKTATDGRDS